MIYDLVSHGAAAELLGSWQFVLGALVITVGPAIAVRRHRVALAALSDDERAAAADRRGKRIEDVLTVVIAAAAAALSASGLRRVGRHQMGLTDPFDLLPFVALDVAAMVCGRRARRRARAGEGPGLSGALFWILAGISAVFSAAEVSSLLGSAVRAVWPVLAAVLWEIGSLEERRAARAGRGRPDRRIALVRLFHPVEAFRVALLLAARQDLSQEEATADVRIGRAAYRWYRLRRVQEAVKHAGRMTRWAYRRAEIHADTRAQRASERAGCSDTHVLEQVVARLQMRVLQTDMAGMNLRTTKAFDQLRGTLIGTILTIPQQHAAPHPATPSHSASKENPQLTGGMGEDADDANSSDDPDTTGPNPPEDAPRDELTPTDRKTDDEVMAAFVATVPRGDDGAFTWGINKCASALGIGNKRAKRFLDTAHEWLPEALKAHTALDGDATADGLDHFDEAVAVGNGQPAEAARPLLLPTHTFTTEQPLLDELLAPATGDGYAQLGNGLLIPAGAGARQP
ncbi:hypothetical protein [Streptomyces sp. MZ04]|uniref:hypothetical protein n=1 Tax=Streptomyces sp. MZ04 TaxID=2559236 RepID=UPI00107E94BE|nr:hypothetical protein [Streptomyces sp. MZ04]TGB07389.1 hypothetical protein E2651_21780 [Streptomyces sp. MZ04]